MFRTKPQIALAMVDRALGHGVRVQAWTFDELYGRDAAFLDGLEQRRQVFVGEVPTNFHGWRGNTSLRKRVQYDLYYITHWTPWLDLRILWMTVFHGIRHRNAY